MDKQIRRVNPACFLSVFLCKSSGEPFHFVCLWWVRSERWERRWEARTRWTESALLSHYTVTTDSCVWQHIQLLIWVEELCILKAGLRTVFRLQIWQMSLVVSAEQKIICPLSSLCALLSLSLSVLPWMMAHSELQQKPQNWASICQHLTTCLSLQTERDGAKESGGRVLSVHLESACVCVY